VAGYFTPLSTLIPSLPEIPILAGIPGWDTLIREVGVRGWNERWNDDYQITTGRAVINADTRVDFFGLQLVFGVGEADQTELDFEFAADRSTLLESLVDKVFEETEVPASIELLDGAPDASAQMRFLQDNGVGDADSALLNAPGPIKSFKLTVRGIGARLRLPPDKVQLGVYERVGDTIVGVKPAPGDAPVDIALPTFTLVIDSVKGVSFDLDQSQALDCPPLLLKGLGIGFELDKVKVDLSREDGFVEVTGRPGFDQTWCGVYIAAARVFNLDELLPFLPDKIEVTDFLIDGEGTTGTFEATWADEDANNPSNTDLFKLGSLALEWEKGTLVRGTADVTLRVGGLGNDWAGIGPDGDLQLSTTLRHNPALSGKAAIGWDFSVRAPGTKDNGLLYLGKNTLQAVTGGAVVGLAVAAGVEDNASLGFAAVGLGVASVLEAAGDLTLERLLLDGLGVRVYHKEVGAHVVQFWDIVLDLQARISLDLDLGFGSGLLPHLKTKKPIGVSVRGLVVKVAVDPPEGAGIETVELVLDHESGVSFDVDEATKIDLGIIVQVTKLAVGRWEQGVWVDFGVEVEQADLDVGFSLSSIRLWFADDGSLARVTPGDVGFSLLVPGALYAQGKVALGDVTQVEARGFIVQAIPPVQPADVFKRGSYVWNAGVGLRLEDLDGVQSVVVSADLEWSSGVPVAFCPTVSWYGISALVAVDATPDVGAEGLGPWFLERAPKNQIAVSKFRGEDGAWGFGLGSVFGSTGDSGTAFNLKAGILLQFPGPVLAITGTGSMLSPKPKMSDTSAGAFSAILVIDFSDEGYISLDARLDYKVPDSGSLLTITVPVEFLAGWGGQGFHLYLGRDKPIEKRVRVKVIELFDLSGYLMLDTKTIPNLAETGVDIPGFAIALGGRAEWEWGLKARFLKIYFYLRVECNLALSLANPVLFFAGVLLEGGLVVKVFGFGFEFGIHVDANFIARNPWRLWGEFRVTIGLPWPLPDIKMSVPFALGDDEVPLPAPPQAVAGMTLMERGSNEPRRLDVGATLQDKVGLDPVLGLNFAFPMRNASGHIGNFSLDGADMTTWWLAAGDEGKGKKGYRFELTNLRLQRKAPNNSWVDVQMTVPGAWTPRGTTRAKGGMPLRDELTLLDWSGPLAARMMGTSARYWDGLLSAYDPCPQVPEPETTCASFNPFEPGPFPPERSLSASPDIDVAPIDLGPQGWLANELLGLGHRPGQITPAPRVLANLPGVRRALQLPMATVQRDSASAVAALLQLGDDAPILPGVELRWTRSRSAEIDLLVPVWTPVRVRFLLGDQRGEGKQEVIESFGLSGADIDFPASHSTGLSDRSSGWRHLRFHFDELSEGVSIEVLAIEQKRNQALPVWLYRVCVFPDAPAQAFDEARRTRKAWRGFWSDLASQDAATSSALLLDPNSHYRLEVDYTWAVLEGEPQAEGATGTGNATFEFHTTNEAPTSLRSREHSVGGGEDDWDIDTVPANGTFAAYTTRPLGMLFRHPRTEAIFARFGRRLVLRLVDEDGHDLLDRIALLQSAARDLPEYQQRLWDFTTGLECTPGAAHDLMQAGVAHFASVLTPETWYDAHVVSVPDAAGTLDLTALPNGWRWEDHPVVHRFRFRTSRYRDLAHHLGDVVVLDEFCDTAPDLAAVQAAAGMASGLVVDDQVLDGVLTALKLPPRPPPWRGPPTEAQSSEPPRRPELCRVWAPAANGGHDVVALLVDSPEPFGVDGVSLGLQQAGIERDSLQVHGRSRARAVVLRSSGGQLQPLSPGAWELVAEDRWLDAEETQTIETHSLPVDLPAIPAVFGPEED